MSERAPAQERKDTIIENLDIMRYLGKKSIDAATLPWIISSHSGETRFPVGTAFVPGRHGETVVFVTPTRQTDEGFEFPEYPPHVLIYTEDEWDAFIKGVKAGEFN